MGQQAVAQKTSASSTLAPTRVGLLLQRQCACGSHTTAGGDCESCKKEAPAGGTLQRAAAARAGTMDEVPPIVHEVLRSPGRPLDVSTRSFMEPRFNHDFSRVRTHSDGSALSANRLGINPPADAYEQEADRVAENVLRVSTPSGYAASYDFSGVRVHTDVRAAQSARAVNALAYTVGQNIVFDTAQYSPGTFVGKRLLAHELAHVVQQTNSLQPMRVQRQSNPASPPMPEGGLPLEMLKQIARRLREAMVGLGTDEEAIYSAMAGRTQDQVNEIARVYQDMYQRDLRADLQDELNESELAHLGIFAPLAAPGASGTSAEQSAGLADMVAAQLDKAMKGSGTDEDSIYAALTGRTEAERQAIKEAYRRLTNRELEAALRDDLSDSELTHALMLLNQGMLQPEDELYLAMAGLGTDEDTIFRVLRELSGNVAALQSLQLNYDRKYGDLIYDLRDDLSASEYAQARQYIRPTLADADVQDCDSNANPLQQPNTVRDAHALAFAMLNTAIGISGNTNDPTVQAMAARHFHITLPPTTPEQTILWARVRRALETMAQADTEATYECEPVQNLWNGACLANNVAISLLNIHLCPLWWTYFPTVDERAYVLVHEWGHKFGAGVNRVFETYCWAPEFATMPADELIQSPDAYAAYAYEAHLGAQMPCK